MMTIAFSWSVKKDSGKVQGTTTPCCVGPFPMVLKDPRGVLVSKASREVIQKQDVEKRVCRVCVQGDEPDDQCDE